MRFRVVKLERGLSQELDEEVVEEAPLQIYINGNYYTTLFRTPGEDIPLVKGFCFTEGLWDGLGDISFEFGENKVEVSLEKPLRPLKTVEEVISLKGTSIKKMHPISVMDVLRCMKIMEENQGLRKSTKASHAVMLFSGDLSPISIGEDVGRHCAFDKALGKGMEQGGLSSVFLATLSSRISFEMAKKAAVAGIPMVFGVSRPTSMAIKLGEALGMCLGSLRGEGVVVYTGKEMVRC